MLILPLVGPAGCRNTTPTSELSSRRFNGLSLRVACPTEAAAKLVTRFGHIWATQNGVRLETVPYATETDPPAAADIWIIEAAEMPRWASAGKLSPVPEAYRALGPSNSYDWGDLLPLHRSLLLQYAGQTYGLPLRGDNLLCYYRSDLLRDPSSRQAFKEKYGRELAPPATWDEFVELAGFFDGRRADGARAAPRSLAPLPAESTALAREFFTVAAPHVVRTIGEGTKKPPPAEEILTFQFDYGTGLPNISAPGFVRALQMMQQLQKFRDSGVSAEPAAAFRDGQAVLCLAGPAWLARCSATDSPVRDRFEVCRLPGSRRVHGQRDDLPGGDINYAPYLDGSWLGVVPVGGPHADAAFELLAELSKPATSREIVSDPLWGGGPTRRSHFSRAEDWYGFGLGTEATAALRETVRRALDALPINPPLRLRVPDQRELQAILVEEVRPALAQGGDPHQTLDAVARRWRERDDKRTAETRREEYRRSLGR